MGDGPAAHWIWSCSANVTTMHSQPWDMREQGTAARLNSSLVWLGVTVFYLYLMWLDLEHVATPGMLRLIIPLRGVLLLLAAWHGIAVLAYGTRDVFNAIKWGIVAAHFVGQILMAFAYEPSHIIQIVVPLPTIFVVYYVVAATPALAIVTGIGQTLLSAVLTLVGAGFSFDTALVLIPIMVILNAVGIAHLGTSAGRENASFVESELPVRTSPAVSRLPLSPRERDVVMELLKGRTRSQIGEALFISPETVKWHTSRIYRKLGVSSRIQLLQRVLGETDVPSAE